MPRIDDYVRIGRCLSYGDFDWQIEVAKLENLPHEEIEKFMLTMFHCQRQIWEYWWQKNQPQQAAAQR